MGRDKRNENRAEQWTKMLRPLMQEPAWGAMCTASQALYPWLRIECRTGEYSRNGHFQFSVRQAAEALGVSKNTAGKALLDLQAKGFLVVTLQAILGVAGQARGNTYELTELPMKGTRANVGRQLYKSWKKDGDFPTTTCKSNNPNGVNGKQNPVSKTGTSRTNDRYVEGDHVPIIETGRTNDGYEQGQNDHPNVPEFRTSLSTRDRDDNVIDLNTSQTCEKAGGLK